MLTSLKLWNEPNNLSHWDFLLDPGWEIYCAMIRQTAAALREDGCALPLVLGGLSPIDTGFLHRLREQGALDQVDILAVHGFPLDWSLWPLEEWPARLARVRRGFGMPVWVTETGVSSFASEETQAWGLRRLTELLRGERVYWYSLMDLPSELEATTRHKQAEGSSYYRHFHFGLLRSDGTPKAAVDHFPAEFGICQWFQHGDENSLRTAVDWCLQLGVTEIRTGLSWADSHLPGAESWFDTLMSALEPFSVCATLCFTPPSRGQRPDHTAPPLDTGEFVHFALEMARRYARPGVSPTA